MSGPASRTRAKSVGDPETLPWVWPATAMSAAGVNANATAPAAAEPLPPAAFDLPTFTAAPAPAPVIPLAPGTPAALPVAAAASVNTLAPSAIAGEVSALMQIAQAQQQQMAMLLDLQAKMVADMAKSNVTPTAPSILSEPRSRSHYAGTVPDVEHKYEAGNGVGITPDDPKSDDEQSSPKSHPRSTFLSGPSVSRSRGVLLGDSDLQLRHRTALTPAKPKLPSARDNVSLPSRSTPVIGKIPTIPIEAFNGQNKDVTVAQWIRQFGLIAQASAWDDATAIRMAGLKLSGSAQDWYYRNGHMCTKWSDFRDSLCRRYGVRVNRTLARESVEGMVQGEKESVEEFLDRILTALSKFGSIEEDDAIVADAFLHGLRPIIYNRLLDRYDGIELDDVRMDDLLASASKEEVILTSRRAHDARVKRGHKDSDDSKPPKAGGFTRSQQLQVGMGNGRDKSNVVCHKCQGKGHYANACPVKGAVGGAAPVALKANVAVAAVPVAQPGRPKCRHCGKGHSDDQCWIKYPEKRPKAGNPIVNQRMVTELKDGVLHVSDGMCPGSMYVDTRIGGVLIKGTLDTGAGVSLLHVSVFREMSSAIKQTLKPRPGFLRTATGEIMKLIGQIDVTVRLKAIEGGIIEMPQIFTVVPELSCQCILGFDFMDQYVASQSLSTDMMLMKPNVVNVQHYVKMTVVRTEPKEEKVTSLSTDEPVVLEIAQVASVVETTDPSNDHESSPALIGPSVEHVVPLSLKVRGPQYPHPVGTFKESGVSIPTPKSVSNSRPAPKPEAEKLRDALEGSMTRHIGRSPLKHRENAVRLTADVVLPPLSIANVPATAITHTHVKWQGNPVWFVHGDKDLQNDGVMVAATIHSVTNPTPNADPTPLVLQMVNTTNKTVKYKHGRYVAVLKLAQVLPEVLPQGTPIRQVSESELLERQASQDKEDEIALSIVDRIQSEDPSVSAIKSPEQRKMVLDAILPYTHLFDDRNLGAARHGNEIVEHKINTGSRAPIYQHPRRQPPALEAAIDAEIAAGKASGVIKDSTSPWASPIVMVRKKDGKWRMCIDYRRLNAITVADVYPLPPIDQMLYNMRGAKVFTTMDLQSAYNQILVADQDREKTAFIHRSGLYEFIRLPFGLRNAPATFQRFMNMMLSSSDHSLRRCVMAYLDDVVIFSNTVEEHAEQLKSVLAMLSRHGLKLKLSKCTFAVTRTKYLGHILDGDGVHVDPDYVKAVVEMPKPSCVKDVQCFLGLTGYYRRFIPNYSDLAQPLYVLLRKDVQWVWGQAQQFAVDTLKEALTSASVLVMPDYSKRFIIQTDASTNGIGAVLAQTYVMEDGKEADLPIAFISRSLKPAEKNYSVTHLELLAVMFAVKQFRHYVLGSNFLIQTDHRALNGLLTSTDLSGRLQRWLTTLQEYLPFEVTYRKGKVNANADCLSRLPLPTTDGMVRAVVDEAGDVKLAEIGLKQRDDPVWRGIWKYKVHGELPLGLSSKEIFAFERECEQYVVSDGVLQRVYHMNGKDRLDSTVLQLCVTCAGVGLSQQEQVHSTHIRSIIASNANTKSNKCSAMVAMHAMEGKEKSYERVSTH